MQYDHQSKKVLIIGLKSDIAKGLAGRFTQDGWQVAGTCRFNDGSNQFDSSFPLNIDDSLKFKNQLESLYDQIESWDLIIFASGSMLPIGDFFDLQIEEIKKSLFLNLIGPIEILHKLWKKRNRKSRCNIFFFAGGGTNGTFNNYLSYTLAKVSSIKLVELLSSEYPTAGFFSIGTGYIRTKIHKETVDNAKTAGSNYAKTLKLLESEGTSINDVYEVISWCIVNSVKASGRNFSVRDDFNHAGNRELKLLNLLEKNNDALKLRRYLNKWREDSD